MPSSDAAGDAPPFGRIAIAGCGLIGGSLGLALKQRWPAIRITAIDTPDVIGEAVRRGAADEGGGIERAADAELIVLAAPVRTNVDLLADLPRVVSGTAIVTDTGSTKREVDAAAGSLPARLTFTGGHPVAGEARGGIAAARVDLFEGRPWILCPRGGSPADPRLTRLLEGTGASVSVLAADAHDRLLAYLSHLPQLVATALMEVAGAAAGEAGLALAGRGLRDTTRLASAPPDIWRDILATNGDNIGAAVRDLVDLLERLPWAAVSDRGTFDATFASAARWKRSLEKHFDPTS